MKTVQEWKSTWNKTVQEWKRTRMKMGIGVEKYMDEMVHKIEQRCACKKVVYEQRSTWMKVVQEQRSSWMTVV
jgi:hypothetical protein